ncbi:MAG: hypothetical protein ACRDO8_03075 [Nocardioidaceae bacterium]
MNERLRNHGGGPYAPAGTDDAVTIDCDHCLVRGPSACGDCVVTVLLGGPPQGVRLDSDEQSALDALASSGLVPPLRLVTAVDSRQVDSA